MSSAQDSIFRSILRHSGPALSEALSFSETAEALSQWGERGTELSHLLVLRNGFYSWGQALLVRPFSRSESPRGLLQWNVPSLWKKEYLRTLEDALFFAEDLFGGQFALSDSRVKYFEPETGGFEDLSSSLPEWVELVVNDAEYRTGYPLLHEWERDERHLRRGYRLLPKLPFSAGGAFDADNLYELEEVEGMGFRATIANQTTGLSPGQLVTFRRSKSPLDS